MTAGQLCGIVSFGAACGLLSACATGVTVNAAGATFPAPIYQKWFEEFYKIHPDIQINYQAIGSGGGIRQLIAGTVDFGASDKPMSDAEIARVASSHILHFPTVLGAIVPVYNVPGVAQDLNFSGDTLAGIYMGTISQWNDPAIAKENPGVNLPAHDITVAHRSDGSGTTFVFADFLGKANADWKRAVGVGSALSWPKGLGGKGNEGVAGLVTGNPYSIGYVELIYAVQNQMAYGSIKNPAGEFVKASFASVSAAAASKPIPDDFRVSITNAPGHGAYPISTFTWLLVPDTIPDRQKREDIVTFLRWMLTEGQTYAEALSYAPLPPNIASKEEAQIAKIH